MLYETTTLATVARLIGESLEGDYGVDPGPVFDELGIQPSELLKPGARVSFATISKLWRNAVAVTNDPRFGFSVGKRAGVGDFFVLGHAWLASATLVEALRRLCRYSSVISTHGSVLELVKQGDKYALTESYPDGSVRRQQAATDAGFVAILGLCDLVTQVTVRPIRVSLTVAPGSDAAHYTELFRCPVAYGAESQVLVFSASDLEQPLTGSIPDLAEMTDRIASDYVRSLDSGAVATLVRTMLIQKLPSGRTDQDTVARLLHRSRSTLQRQLRVEGTSYKEILETTRRALAERYLADDEYSQAQIAFMTGFADQSNFSRAFKRWTGTSPGEFKKTA